LAYLTKYDLERYDRQIRISGFGEKGQKRLKGAGVLVAGAGGLGSRAHDDNAFSLVSGVDAVVDALDNYEAKVFSCPYTCRVMGEAAQKSSQLALCNYNPHSHSSLGRFSTVYRHGDRQVA
jgi:tRNA A37 threonylcarbamoyladenosine dehydratase